MTRVAFHPSTLLITASLLVVLWAAVDHRSAVATVAAVIVWGVLSFAGALGAGRR